MRRVPFGQAPETYHAAPFDLQAVAAYEQFVSVSRLHKGTVRALIEQNNESVVADLDPGVHTRDEVAFHHDVIVIGAANRDARMALIYQPLVLIELQTQADAAWRVRVGRDRRH